MHSQRVSLRSILVVLTIGQVVELAVLAASPQTESTTLILASIGAVLLLGTIAAMISGTDDPTPDRQAKATALPEYQAHALGELAALPHFRRLLDGGLIELTHGLRIAVCSCRQDGTPHLALYDGDRALFGFLSQESLDQYLSIQKILGRQFVPEGTTARAGVPAHAASRAPVQPLEG